MTLKWDAGAPATDGTKADTKPKPDTLPAPDTKPKPDTTPTNPVGKPCPCTDSKAACIKGICRAKCNAPTGKCQVTSNCPKTHACLGTTAGYHICMPAAKHGAACSKTVYCPVNHVCAAVGSSSLKCLQICNTVGAACGVGGKCVKAPSGCMICSKP